MSDEKPCERCDWTGDEDEATAHARDSGHMLCIVCQYRSLTVHEQQTCALCVGRVRADLADLISDYASIDTPGTDALTLTGDGTMQRHAHHYEMATGVRDEWASDPFPVVAALASWEDFWRADYGDPAGGPATLTGVIDYLTTNLDTGHRAAQTHPAFDEFAVEVHRLRTAVRQAAGLADIPVAAPASCFDCGGQLIRTYIDPTEPVTVRRARGHRAMHRLLEPVRNQREAERTYGIRDCTPWPTGALSVWRRLVAGVPGEGLTDDWTCGWCGRVYDQASYFLALRASSSSWVSVPLAAETARRSVRTVRSWANRGHVAAACRVTDRAVVVWWPDVSDRAFRHAEDAEPRSA